MEEREIRQAINAFSRQKNNHPHIDYGDHIAITNNSDQFVFKCHFQTQYEKRVGVSSKRPYKSPHLWNDTVATNVSVWKYDLERPTSFTDDGSRYRLKDSYRVETCQECNGNSKSKCTTCQGKGQSTCPTCHGNYQDVRCSYCKGRGLEDCHTCHGTGKKDCPKCNGKGRYQETFQTQVYHYDNNLKRQVLQWEPVTKTVSCHQCFGSGKLECTQCNGEGTEKCSKCNGRGRVTCTDCDRGSIKCKSCYGSGSIICKFCDGAGSIEQELAIKQTLSQKKRSVTITDDKIKRFAESNDLSFSTLFNQRKDSFDGDIFPQSTACNQQLMKMRDENRDDSPGRILFEEATVEQAQMALVEYEYQGKNYSGIIHDGTFYPQFGDPVSQWFNNLSKNISKEIEKSHINKALALIQQAEESGEDSRSINLLRFEVRHRLSDYYEAGLITAFWTTLLLLSPVVYWFYAKLNPVASWAVLTNNPHWIFTPYVPISQTLVFVTLAIGIRIFLMDRSTPSLRPSYPNRWIFYSKGIFLYLLCIVGILIVMAGLNYLGLSIVTTILIGLAILVFKWLISIIVLTVQWVINLVAQFKK